MARRAPQPVLRVVLTRELIVHAAVELVEREGARALSMRGVGAELGVSAMAMYRHVPSKDALIEGIAEYVMTGLDVPEEPATDWKAGARALMRAFRAIAQEYPRSLALVVASRIAIPVGLRAIERALSLCADAGLDGPTSVHVTRAMMAYALGSQLREAAQGRGQDSGDDPAATVRTPSAGRFPHVASLPAELAEHGPDADFEFGLELFLSAIESTGQHAP
jgi:AcrR family transcriptional regulator